MAERLKSPVYPVTFEAKLGFDKIRELLTSECLSPLGTEKVSEMSFMTTYNSVVEEMNRTAEFVRILQEEEFPDSGFYDVRDAIKRIRIEGTFVEKSELFDLRRALDAIGAISSFFQSKEEGVYYYLGELSKDIFTFPDIIHACDRIIDKYGEIKDSASPRLKEIRSEIAATQVSISRHMQNILRKAVEDGIVEKDTNPAIRNGRLVIPVSPFQKKKLRGIVHDESATGKTVYIEPEVIVEANNHIRELEGEEAREIIKILTEFTTEHLRSRVDELLFSFEYLSVIDFERAKAKLSLTLQCSLPHIVNEPLVDWKKAVHPLLFLSHSRSGKEIVPLDIHLNNKDRILIISGPNAGGKSVCLKTAGLLQYMLQCGMLVPMNPDSSVGLFDKILVDIGDEQSIENDLSTYSSHMSAMKVFDKESDGHTMLLIDEFGGGTEPQIGGAIAEALLERFNNNGAFGIITTHYTCLKNFANEHEGVVNGAMLYDRHQMRPLFKLEIGNPGSSFALEIARKIGLSEAVISRAADIVGSDYVNMEKYLQDIVRDKRYWESKRQNIRQKEKKIEELEAKYISALENANKERKEILAAAKNESRKIIDTANAKIENTIRTIKEFQAEKEKTKEARKDLSMFRNEIDSENENDSFDNKISRIKEKRDRKSDNNNKPVQEKTTSLTVGSYVRIKGQNGYGTILEMNGKNALIAFGNIKTNVSVKNIEPVNVQTEKKQKFSFNYISSPNTEIIHSKSMNFKHEIDIRGMRVDEARQAVSYYIEDAIVVNAGTVRILHGTGTGALRQVVRDYLKTIAGISFHDEHPDFGGAGITVVDV